MIDFWELTVVPVGIHRTVMPTAATRVYRFKPFCLDPVRRVLTRDDVPVPVPSKVLDLLLALVEKGGTAVAKAELIRALWPDTAVEEGSLPQTVFLLRKVLSERPDEHRYVVTIPGVGYRFVAPVETEWIGGEEGQRSRPQPEVGAGRLPQSIAVLPFAGLGSASSEAYLELGIADALITKLSSIRRVAVRPTTSVLKYHGPGQDPLEAGRELRVDAVLNGTIQRTGDRVRVAIHVVRIDDGATLWAGHIDERLTDVFAVEDSIAEQVTRALVPTLSEEDRERLARRPTESTAAYDAYLKGRFFWNKRTEEGLRRGIGLFEEAIAHDPDYAAAFAGVADCYNSLSAHSALAPKEGYPRAKVAAERALALDDRLGEAHASLAYASLHFYWDWPAAGRGFERALSLNPNYPTGHSWYSGYLAARGRFDEALEEVRHALQLDPLSLVINADMGWICFFARQHDQAIAHLERTVEMDQYFALAHWLLGLNYEQKDMLPEAVAAFQRAAALYREMPSSLTALAHVLAQSGKRDEALRVLEMVLQLAETRYVSSHSVATIYVALGQRSDAIEWLNRACDECSNWLIWLNVDARFDELRGDAGFQAVLRRVGLVGKRSERAMVE